MILTATPHPATDGRPPFVRIEATAPEGTTFTSLKILRNGVPIRSQPPVAGLNTTYTDDYEAPFGVPVRYDAEGSTIGGWSAAYTETWESLTGWTTDDGDPSVSSGRLTGGTVVRSDITIEDIGQVVLSDGSVGWYRLTVGPVMILSMDGERMASFRSGPGEYLSSSGAVTVEWSGNVATVKHSGGTAALIPGSGSPDPGITASTPSGMWPSGMLAGFTYSIPSTGSTPVAETVTTVLDEQWPWLIHPANPSLSVRIDEPCTWGQCGKTDHLHIDPSTAEEVQSEDRRSLFVPYGRRETVMFPLGRRSMGTWDLVLNATGLEARNRVMAALTDQAPLLLRMPPRYADMDLTDGWYSVGAAPVKRLTTDDLRNRRRLLTLEMTRTAIPPVPRVAEFTWGAALARGLIWGDLTEHTWFDLLKGEV